MMSNQQLVRQFQESMLWFWEAQGAVEPEMSSPNPGRREKRLRRLRMSFQEKTVLVWQILVTCLLLS